MATSALPSHAIKDLALADKGCLRIEWAEQEMPVLREISRRFAEEQPLAGVRVAGCLHVTTETANLAITMKAGGAEVALCASNPAVDPGRRRRGTGQGSRDPGIRPEG